MIFSDQCQGNKLFTPSALYAPLQNTCLQGLCPMDIIRVLCIIRRNEETKIHCENISGVENMEKQMVISVMSKDRPGIIADVTGAIFELDGDLADLNQSILCGFLTMILIATFDKEVTSEDVIAKLSHIKAEDKFEAIIKVMDTPIEIAKTKMPEKTYIVTAQGKNKSGLVYGISSFCYSHNINILDLSTTLEDDIYTMILQLDLSKVDSIKEVREHLKDYATETGLHVMMQHYEIFRVTHEVAQV